MLFKTESGSVYELDEPNKRIRRITNINRTAATPRQGNDEWKNYIGIAWLNDDNPASDKPVIGASALISWDKQTTPLLSGSPDYATPATLTSIITEIIDQS